MKLSQIKRYRKRPRMLPRMVVDNPLLLLGLDLPFIVVSAYSLKNAVALSIEMFFIHMVTMFVAYFVVKKLKIWQRVFVTTLVATVMMIISRELVIYLIPDIETYAGMYLYLMAVNGVTLFQANFLSRKVALGEVLRTALLNVAAFTLGIIGIAIIREYFSNGTLWGMKVPSFIRLDGIRAPFFGFILVGFLLALFHNINRMLSGFLILENIRRQTAIDPPESQPEVL